MKGLRIMFSVMLTVIGILHFTHEKVFRRIIPPALPFRKAAVLITGVAELLFAVLLWVQKGQTVVGKLLALFMILVFPANIYSTYKDNLRIGDKKVPQWALWARLPMQIPLIYGAIKLTHSHDVHKEENR
ncbi:hypothetical protein MM326_17570 [Alkalihalobacillus sp. LMS6]|uniref:DoxX family protein n=1 Tax=Alkalihalobacillus sp. LMS6 TaxID=2924034 RepID=UPI0020D15087|nr:hypothetical protein [Alkalihalobacillus sp. LMS6]UTR05866.1 hypothetical protein MM326_17570 [Alkalihalobacillus sp. LMS6]